MPPKKNKIVDDFPEDIDFENKNLSGVYLVQSAIMRIDVWKVGMSNTNVFTRVRTAYNNCFFTRIHLTPYFREMETHIKREFKKKYRIISGTEFHEGNLMEALKDFDRIFYEYTKVIQKREEEINMKKSILIDLTGHDDSDQVADMQLTDPSCEPDPLVSIYSSMTNLSISTSTKVSVSENSELPTENKKKKEMKHIGKPIDTLKQGNYEVIIKFYRLDKQKKTNAWFEVMDETVVDLINSISKIDYYPTENGNRIKIIESYQLENSSKDNYITRKIRLRTNSFYGKKILSLSLVD